jgi:hypothetical protein
MKPTDTKKIALRKKRTTKQPTKKITPKKKRTTKQPTKKTAPKKKRTTKQLDPRSSLHAAYDMFLCDLDCAREMFDTVIPVLQQRDDSRRKRIAEINDHMKILRKTDTNGASIDKEKLVADITDLLDAVTKLNRASQMFRHNSIVILLSRYDQYLADVYRAVYRSFPERLQASEKSLTYQELQLAKDISEAVDKIIDKEVDTQLRQSHADKLTFLDRQLKLDLKTYLPDWTTFIELTERRHLFAHTGGKVIPQYIEACRKNGSTVSPKIKVGVHLGVSPDYFHQGVDCLYLWGLTVGQLVYRRLYPKNADAADSMLNEQAFELLKKERWALAKSVYEFALSLPDKVTSSDDFRKIFLINRCIALKNLKEGKDLAAALDAVDWSSANPKFTLAVSVLKDDYPMAEKIMSHMDGEDPIDEQSFRTWPLFRDFRMTKHFRRAFKRIYKKDYSAEVPPELKLLKPTDPSIA